MQEEEWHRLTIVMLRIIHNERRPVWLFLLCNISIYHNHTSYDYDLEVKMNNEELKKLIVKATCKTCGGKLRSIHYFKMNDYLFCSQACFDKWEAKQK